MDHPQSSSVHLFCCKGRQDSSQPWKCLKHTHMFIFQTAKHTTTLLFMQKHTQLHTHRQEKEPTTWKQMYGSTMQTHTHTDTLMCPLYYLFVLAGRCCGWHSSSKDAAFLYTGFSTTHTDVNTLSSS